MPKILKILASTRKRLSVIRNYNRESNFEISHDTDFNPVFNVNLVFNRVSRPKGSSLFLDRSSPLPEPRKTYTTKFPYHSMFYTENIDNNIL